MDKMEDKWVLSSSGRHMYISFVIAFNNTSTGFYANIQYGIKFKKLLLALVRKHRFHTLTQDYFKQHKKV